MNHARTASPTAATALACGNCGEPMQRLEAEGHYQRLVTLDICGGCHLVWFDEAETARLNGVGLLDLIGHMARLQPEPHHVLKPHVHCPRCAGPLKTVHNLTRFGRSLQLECARHHGAYQSFAQFMSEKGLVRPMTRIDRAALLRRDGRIACLNCGADIGAQDESCAYCGSQPGLFDVARLARALDPEDATTGHELHGKEADTVQRSCLACGAPMPEGESVQCPQCRATLAISRLADAYAQVRALSEALAAHARKPVAAVVQRRLAEQQASIERQRDWARRLEAQAREAQGQIGGADDRDWLEASRYEIVVAALLGLMLWWLWR